jgi:transcriptional regulator with XRE-family HTH domain
LSEQAIAARKAFGIRLRDIRKDAGMNGRTLAQALGWHPSKVSRIEHGQQNPSEEDIRAWAIQCGVARQIPELIAVHREIEQMWVEWRRELRAGQRRLQASATDLYERTKLLRAYESIIVPGILQVRGYVHAVMEANARLFDLPIDELDAAADARLERQHLVTDGGPNTFAFVIEAGALAPSMGGIEVMHAQYDFLLQVTRLPNVSFGVIPPGRRRTLFGGEGFYMFDDNLVRNDLWSGSVRTSRPEEIAHYRRVFGMLHEMAVYGDPARDLIEAARAQLPQSGAIS